MKWIIVFFTIIIGLAMVGAQLQVGNPDENIEDAVFLFTSTTTAADGDGITEAEADARYWPYSTVVGQHDYDLADYSFLNVNQVNFGAAGNITNFGDSALNFTSPYFYFYGGDFKIWDGGDDGMTYDVSSDRMTIRGSSTNAVDIYGSGRLDIETTDATSNYLTFYHNPATRDFHITGEGKIKWGSNINGDTSLEAAGIGYLKLDGNPDGTLEVTDDIIIGDDLEVGDIAIIDSNLTAPNICYSDGTNCTASDTANFTNVAYLNNTQTFTANNTFNGYTIFNGNLSGNDYEIFIDRSHNLTWARQKWGCLKWDNTPPSSTASICGTSGTLTLFASIVNFPVTQKLTLGDDSQNQAVGFCSTTAGADDCMEIQDTGSDPYWRISLPLGFDALGRSNGLVMSHFNKFNNFSWNGLGCLTGNCDFNWNSVGDFEFTGQNSINTTNDFCITGGNCLSEMGAGTSFINQTTWTYASLTDETISGTSYTQSTYLWHELDADYNYTFTFTLYMNAQADDFRLNITAYANDLNYMVETSDSTLIYVVDRCDEGDAWFGLDCENVPHLGTKDVRQQVDGFVSPISDGNLSLEYREITDVGGDSKIYQGSSLTVRRVEQ